MIRELEYTYFSNTRECIQTVIYNVNGNTADPFMNIVPLLFCCDEYEKNGEANLKLSCEDLDEMTETYEESGLHDTMFEGTVVLEDFPRELVCPNYFSSKE